MNNTNVMGECDTCDAPATIAAVDMTDTTQPGDEYVTYKPRGAPYVDSSGRIKVKPRRGCADHPVASDTYNEKGELIKAGVYVKMRTFMPDWEKHFGSARR